MKVVLSSSISETDYELVKNEVLTSATGNQYEVLEFLGKGTYGQVVRCQQKGTTRNVAIKVLENDPRNSKKRDNEVSIIQQLSVENPAYNFVQAFEFFEHKQHKCIVFEMLRQSLFDYVVERESHCLPLKHIRPIVQQLLTALDKLKTLGLIHADLKPANIMLVDPIRQPFRIKVIDFGLSISVSEAAIDSCVQSRFYRAPEVLLGFPFNEAIDMWSLGCLMAELFLGWPLYPGRSEYDQIRYIVETQGLPASNVLNSGARTRQFFVPVRTPLLKSHFWRLKSRHEFEAETRIRSCENRIYIFDSLRDLAKVNPPMNLELDNTEALAEKADRRQFTDLVERMLSLDPDTRITPKDAANHNFMKLKHLDRYDFCRHVRHSVEIMEELSDRAMHFRAAAQAAAYASMYQQPIAVATAMLN
ncbi:homeodomain-interacting protein kinase 1-like [Varroa destructor]|uniref:Protein kinase domain-containing protein n=1 Tax=Varroa destructor TaxID=109461 RepID=A0A7M7IX28_VARDE|nr:homeodomain-interacting protein kinase 1-like [Varroa destructor]XP_022643771.1 homeodomain-interacting protein kinase 1-like [Varroa destructor]